MKKNVFMFLTLVFLVFSVLSVSACNTVDGFGKDLENAGESLQKTTKK